MDSPFSNSKCRKENMAKAENLPAVLDFSQDANKGFDAVEPSDFGVPIVKVLQKMSPAVDDVESAKPGDFYVATSGQLWDGTEGLKVIPSYYRKVFTIWTPRDLGGGYQGELAPDDPIVKEATQQGAKKVLENGDELVETVNWYLSVVNDDSMPMRVLFPMSSTQLRVSRKFISLSSGIKLKDVDGNLYTPAMFSHVYKMTTQQETNAKGSWFSLSLSLAGPVGDAITYENAKELYGIAKSISGPSLPQTEVN